MKEIPLPYVRTNQAGIVLFVAAALLVQNPWIVAALWAVQLSGWIGGVKANAFVRIAKPFLADRIMGARTESAELQRFNNTIAVALLTLSVVSFLFGWNAAGYVFASLVALAAFVAICGFCVGCFLYYQFKRLKH